MKIYPITIPGGSDTYVQYNNGGIFGGDSALTWDDGAAKALTIGNCAVLGSDSAVFQPNADSTTFFQILDADGDTSLFNIDSTNERIGVGTNFPQDKMDIRGTVRIQADGAFHQILQGYAKSSNTSGCKIEFNSNTDVSVRQAQFQLDNSGNMVFRTEQSGLYFDAKSTAKIYFRTTGSYLKRLVIANAGNIGINEDSPETLLELTHVSPYITLHNSTHEDADGGRESRLNFKGEQSGEEETTLARIEVSHDGDADDEKGKIVISTNDGSDSDTPTEALRLDEAQNATFAGAINSNTLTLSAAGPTDDLDVSGVNTVFVDTSGNDVTLGGTVGGVDGQVLNIAVHDATNNFTIEDNEGTGNQDFVLHAGADEVMTAEYGGWTFVNEGGSHWHDCSHAKHV